MSEFWVALESIFFKDANLLKRFHTWVGDRGPDIIIAIITFLIGRAIIRFIRQMIEKVMIHGNYDRTAMTFISQIAYYTMYGVLVLICINQIGIPTTSFVAAFGAFGIAIGLALQNNMSNFASGLLLLLFKPFKVGDWISTDNNVEGTVKSIQFMHTVIATKENKLVYVPNSLLTSQVVTNTTTVNERVMSFSFDINYANDHHKAIELLKTIFKSHDEIINADTLEIGIREFAENSVRIVAYPKVRTEKYWPVFYEIMSQVKDTFDANGIDIPYPQRVIHVYEAPEETKNNIDLVDNPESDADVTKDEQATI